MVEKKIIFLNDQVVHHIQTRGRVFSRDFVKNIGDHKVIINRMDSGLNLNDYDLSILTIKDYWYRPDNPTSERSRNCIRRKQEVLTSLKQGKTVVLLVEAADDLLIPLMQSLNISVKDGEDYTKDLKTDMTKFEEVVERYCNPTVFFEGDKLNAICSFNNNICGFFVKEGKGKLYVLPAVLKHYSPTYYLPLFKMILEGITALDFEFILPKYLQNLEISNESCLIEDRISFTEKINNIDLELEKLVKHKSILALKHGLLVENTMLLFEEIGIDTYCFEKYEEDFWIMKEGERKIIVEVKGTKSNFGRAYINALDNHRDENGLDKKFPALLIVNTFAEVNSLKEKDIPPEGDTIRRANVQDIKIIRTLDLFNLYKLINNNEVTPEDFLAIVNDSIGGWIKVTNKIELITN